MLCPMRKPGRILLPALLLLIPLGGIAAQSDSTRILRPRQPVPGRDPILELIPNYHYDPAEFHFLENYPDSFLKESMDSLMRNSIPDTIRSPGAPSPQLKKLRDVPDGRMRKDSTMPRGGNQRAPSPGSRK